MRNIPLKIFVYPGIFVLLMLGVYLESHNDIDAEYGKIKHPNEVKLVNYSKGYYKFSSSQDISSIIKFYDFQFKQNNWELIRESETPQMWQKNTRVMHIRHYRVYTKENLVLSIYWDIEAPQCYSIEIRKQENAWYR